MSETTASEAVPSGAASEAFQRCTKCEQDKPFLEFAVRNNRKSGRAPWCKPCTNRWASEYRMRTRSKPTTEQRICETCGAEFTWSSMHSTQVFCSKKCYKPRGTRLQQLQRRALEGMRVCKACLEGKSLDQFSPKSKKCKPCASVYQLQWREANLEKVKKAQRQSQRKSYPVKKYGISREEYEQRRAASAGCEICGGANENGKPLHLDHDHATGALRGFLCENHNRGLGMFQDDPALLRAAADYLERT